MVEWSLRIGCKGGEHTGRTISTASPNHGLFVHERQNSALLYVFLKRMSSCMHMGVRKGHGHQGLHSWTTTLKTVNRWRKKPSRACTCICKSRSGAPASSPGMAPLFRGRSKNA